MSVGASSIRTSRFAPHLVIGDSLRRKTERAQAYCAQHGLTLDRSLRLQDLGAFRRAVVGGVVQPGSMLLVESSQQAARLLLNILASQVRLSNTPTFSIWRVECFKGAPNRASHQFGTSLASREISVSPTWNQARSSAETESNRGSYNAGCDYPEHCIQLCDAR